jgi:hypothetical protein
MRNSFLKKSFALFAAFVLVCGPAFFIAKKADAVSIPREMPSPQAESPMFYVTQSPDGLLILDNKLDAGCMVDLPGRKAGIATLVQSGSILFACWYHTANYFVLVNPSEIHQLIPIDAFTAIDGRGA